MNIFMLTLKAAMIAWGFWMLGLAIHELWRRRREAMSDE